MVIPKIETSIWLALKSAVDAMVTAPPMQVFEPGETIEPPSDVTGLLPFVTVSDPRNDNVRAGINSSLANTRSGTLLITIQWPLANPVSHESLVQMGAVVAGHFPEDRCMRYGEARLRVTRDSDVLAPYVAGAYRVIPVRVFWVTS